MVQMPLVHMASPPFSPSSLAKLARCRRKNLNLGRFETYWWAESTQLVELRLLVKFQSKLRSQHRVGDLRKSEDFGGICEQKIKIFGKFPSNLQSNVVCHLSCIKNCPIMLLGRDGIFRFNFWSIFGTTFGRVSVQLLIEFRLNFWAQFKQSKLVPCPICNVIC